MSASLSKPLAYCLWLFSLDLMQFQNISVAKKVWALVIAILVLLVAASLGLARHISNLEQEVRENTSLMEHRILLASKLRTGMDLGGAENAASNLGKDLATQDFFDARFARTKQRNAAMMQEFLKVATTPESEALMASLMAQLKKCDALIDESDNLRKRGVDVDDRVRGVNMVCTDEFTAKFDEMVDLQNQMKQAYLAKADEQRRTAWLVASLCFAVVIIVSLLVASWLVRQLTEPLGHAVVLAQEIAKGNLTHELNDSRQDELGVLLRALNTMTQKLRALVGEVRHGVDSVQTAAAQIAEGNQDLSVRTEQTAANLEETASSLEELNAHVSQASDTARQASQLAATAAKAAEHGGDVVSQVVHSMEQINTSSRKISDIIGVIDGIAFQTNILALNAAVEAARAGEQGRGFAVVAGEVRSLAGRSAEAAKEIKELITSSVANVDTGTQQVAEAGKSMQDIVDSVRRVTDLISEIAAAATEQRDGFGQVNQAVNNLDQMTQQNAALVEESSAAALAMKEQTQRLAEQVAQFNLGARQNVM